MYVQLHDMFSSLTSIPGISTFLALSLLSFHSFCVSHLFSSSSESSDSDEEEDEDAPVASEVVSSTVNEEELPPEILTGRPSWLYRSSKTPSPPPGEEPRYMYTCLCVHINKRTCTLVAFHVHTCTLVTFHVHTCTLVTFHVHTCILVHQDILVGERSWWGTAAVSYMSTKLYKFSGGGDYSRPPLYMKPFTCCKCICVFIACADHLLLQSSKTELKRYAHV